MKIGRPRTTRTGRMTTSPTRPARGLQPPRRTRTGRSGMATFLMLLVNAAALAALLVYWLQPGIEGSTEQVAARPALPRQTESPAPPEMPHSSIQAEPAQPNTRAAQATDVAQQPSPAERIATPAPSLEPSVPAMAEPEVPSGANPDTPAALRTLPTPSSPPPVLAAEAAPSPAHPAQEAGVEPPPPANASPPSAPDPSGFLRPELTVAGPPSFQWPAPPEPPPAAPTLDRPDPPAPAAASAENAPPDSAPAAQQEEATVTKVNPEPPLPAPAHGTQQQPANPEKPKSTAAASVPRATQEQADRRTAPTASQKEGRRKRTVSRPRDVNSAATRDSSSGRRPTMTVKAADEDERDPARRRSTARRERSGQERPREANTSLREQPSRSAPQDSAAEEIGATTGSTERDGAVQASERPAIELPSVLRPYSQ